MSDTRPSPTHADAFVRPAHVDDAPTLGELQVGAWRADYADILGTELSAALDPAQFAAAWAEALAQHLASRRDHHLLVAIAGTRAVGFAAVQPSPDRDAHERDLELTALVVDPAARGAGHASRLLAAASDVARADGAAGLTIWVVATDRAREAWLTEAGFAPDGAERSTELAPDRPLRERRWGASLA